MLSVISPARKRNIYLVIMSFRKPLFRDTRDDTAPADARRDAAAPPVSVPEAPWRRPQRDGDAREYSPPHSYLDGEASNTFAARAAFDGIAHEKDFAPGSTQPKSSRQDNEMLRRDEAARRDEFPAPSDTDGKADDDVQRVASSRHASYESHVLTLLRERLRFVCVLTLVMLPIFNAFHTHFTPREYSQLLISYFCLSAICLVTFFLTGRLRTLRAVRFLTLFAYAMYCFKASMALSLTGDNNPAFLLGSHNHIVLSLLLLPLCVWECLAIGAIALGTLAWSAWWVLMPQQADLYYSHVFITALTIGWVMCIAHFQDATRRQAFNATFDLADSARRLRALTFRDALTGGYNRRYLESALETEIARAARYGRPLSVVMFDLDNFKNINDSCGHSTGDEVLRAVWRATMKIVRGIDTPARYGGDEFALVLPEADEAAARSIVARLQQSVAEELNERFGEGTLAASSTLSIGLATARLQNVVSPQELLDCADKFLYIAKRSGKNTIAS